MVSKRKFKASDALCCLCAAALILTLSFAFLPRGEEKIYDSVIRLHILANSDSEEDIAVKYAVRDCILNDSELVFSTYDNIAQAEADAERIGNSICEIANAYLAENGLKYRASFVWGKEAYPTRIYDGISFPAGEYSSLRIMLGEGIGENWWCVLFPPLCTSAAKATVALNDAGISEERQKTFTNSEKKYVFRFKFLEWSRKLFG